MTSFDVIAANILAGPPQQLAEHFVIVEAQGQVVLSGIRQNKTMMLWRLIR